MKPELKQQMEGDIRRLLSGTHPRDVPEEVASANATSRSSKFAVDEGTRLLMIMLAMRPW